MSDSLRPHGLKPTRLLCPLDFPGKSTGVGSHCLYIYIGEWAGQPKPQWSEQKVHPQFSPCPWEAVYPDWDGDVPCSGWEGPQGVPGVAAAQPLSYWKYPHATACYAITYMYTHVYVKQISMFLCITELSYLIFCEIFSYVYVYLSVISILIVSHDFWHFKAEEKRMFNKTKQKHISLPQSHFSFLLVEFVSMNTYYLFIFL